MATVYLAQDLRYGRPVALKVLEPELAAAVGAQRFLNEIQVTANLQHPHILPLYDSGSADGALFYVMPLVRGESLQDRLAREKLLPVDEAIRITRQVAGALDFAHRQGIIHRDVKPANILLHDGEAMLTDFGIALAVTEAEGGRLTGTGLSIGTVQYMSPEQAGGERDLDARSDIYSLAAVTYEMLAGEPPVIGRSPAAIIAKLLTERPTPLRLIRDFVPRSLDEAVMRALAREPTDRFSGAREFADALTAPEVTATSDIGAGAMPVAAAPRRTRTMALTLVGVLAVVGAYAVARNGLPWRSASALPGGNRPALIRSIAVLPLDNYSGDSTQEYFAEGMTDELTAALATISQLAGDVARLGNAVPRQEPPVDA